jgi:rhodanese-related sulfurtransferase
MDQQTRGISNAHGSLVVAPDSEDTTVAVKNESEPFTRIDVDEAKEMIDAGGVQVIDSREMHEHMDGHVPGSLQIQHMATLSRADDLSKDQPILFICKSGQRSAVAAEFAAALGLTDLYNVEGGHDAWAAAGHPMEQ